MENSSKPQQKQPVGKTDGDSYDQLLEVVNQYWVKGARGDLNSMMDKKVYDTLGIKKGYFRTRISNVINKKVTDFPLLLEMYKQVQPRKQAVEQARINTAELSMQRVS